MRKTTIEDVARLAGVSIKTVSRVVNREPSVRPATCERVGRAITELGYRPNTAARSLASSHAYLVSLLYINLASVYIINILSAGKLKLSVAKISLIPDAADDAAISCP